MKTKKSTYKPKSRKDLSNPNNKLTHKRLLSKAGVESYNGKYTIKDLGDGRIKLNSDR